MEEGEARSGGTRVGKWNGRGLAAALMNPASLTHPTSRLPRPEPSPTDLQHALLASQRCCALEEGLQARGRCRGSNRAAVLLPAAVGCRCRQA